MTNVRGREEKRLEGISYVVMIFLCFCALAPFVLLIMASFTEEASAVVNGYRFIPEKFSLAAYRYIFAEWQQIGHAYLITLIVTVIGTTCSILFTTAFAFGLTAHHVPGLKIVFILTLITMLFNGGIVSTYYVYCNLFHMKNTIWGLIFPGLLMNGFNVILVRNYISSSIPGELLEAAEIDGASVFRIFFSMIMPLSKPIIATIGLMSAITYWNDWNNGLYYITKSNLYSIQQLLNQMNSNIQYLLNNAKGLAGTDAAALPGTTIRMAIAVVAILPILIAYPFFQKYFAKGLTVGAVKG